MMKLATNSRVVYQFQSSTNITVAITTYYL